LRRVVGLVLVALFFFIVSFVVAYRLFSLPRLQQLLEMVNLIHLCGMGFFYAVCTART